MPRSFNLLLLLLQLVFAALPGDGLVLCFGGEHGPFGLCERGAEDHGRCDEHGSEHGSELAPEVAASHDGPWERPAGDHCHDCDGAHLTRGALEPWQPTAAPDHSLRGAGDGPAWFLLAWQPERSRARCADPCRVHGPRRAPPPPLLALLVVRMTELRI